MNRYKEISFFKGLNSLRFFAALFVVMHHSETIKKKSGLVNLEWLGFFRNGPNAVTFFFVLSGFLITYLLLQEAYTTKTIGVMNFYKKRMLRIWPLYFLLVGIGLFFLPEVFKILHINYEQPYTFKQVWYYFIFFLPGLVRFFYGHHFLEPLWSIGVEEVFYLIWAPLFKKLKDNILQLLLAVIFFKIILLTAALYFIEKTLFYYLVTTFQFEAMAIGGLGAYFIFYRGSSVIKSLFYKKTTQILVYLILAAYLIFHDNISNVVWNCLFKVPIASQIFIDFLYLYLIIGVSLANNSIIKLRSKFLSFLGEISYGIYMYHMLIMFTIIQFLKKYLMNINPLLSFVIFYSVLIPMVIGVSAVSKITFENYFLNFKKKGSKNIRANVAKKAERA